LARPRGVEFKNVEAIRIKNLIRTLMTSNEGWVVPADLGERRFAAFDVNKAICNNHPYFAAIHEELNNGGYEALLYQVLHEVDVSKVNLRDVPKTEALLDQKIESLTPEQSWWFDLLSSGRLPDGAFEKNTAPATLLFDNYILHAQRQGARRRSIEVSIARFIRKIVGPKFRKFEGQYDGFDKTTGEPKLLGGTLYRFPPLDECRKFFEGEIQQKIDWTPLWVEHNGKVVEFQLKDWLRANEAVGSVAVEYPAEDCAAGTPSGDDAVPAEQEVEDDDIPF
jgi:hypothetical protein